MADVTAMRVDERAAALQAAQEQARQGWAPRISDQIIDAESVDDMSEPVPLVGNVLYLDSIAWLFGPPASGKSFIALDIAGCVGTGESWQSLGRTQQGTAVYVAAEGVSGLRKRIRAWRASMGIPMKNVKVLPMAVQASNAAMWDGFIEAVSELKPSIIVLDTQARMAAGLEENSATEMGRFVQALERLREATGACVLVVHHTGRGGEHMRGSIALDGAATTMLKVTRSEDIIDIECTKQKDGAESDPIRLRLVPFETSAIVSVADIMEIGSRVSHASTKMVASWWDSFETDWVSVRVMCETTGTVRATFFRNAKSLLRAGLIESKGEGNAKQYRLTRNPGVSQSQPSLTESHRSGIDESQSVSSVSPPFRGETYETETRCGSSVPRDWSEFEEDS